MEQGAEKTEGECDREQVVEVVGSRTKKYTQVLRNFEVTFIAQGPLMRGKCGAC